MRTTIEEIENNTVTHANIPATPFDQTSADQLAEALSKNTSVTRITLSSCELVDDEFITISKALLKRDVTLTELNLDHNSLTIKSIDLLCELIEAHKLKRLDFFKGGKFFDDSHAMHPLKTACESAGVTLNLGRPNRRPDYASTFFPEPKKDIVDMFLEMKEQKEPPKNSR